MTHISLHILNITVQLASGFGKVLAESHLEGLIAVCTETVHTANSL